MKKAFTMIELVFVIVIIGILSSQITPSFDRNTLQEAANQVVSHIRYTQHLAMMDNKFDSNDGTWFKKRWQLKFHKTVGGVLTWSYSIFSDSSKDGNPNVNKELAKNPLNQIQFLTGGFSGGSIGLTDSRRLKGMALNEKFGIKDIKFVGCGNTARRIAFDMLGRPIIGNIKVGSHPYESGVVSGSPLRTQCRINLCNEKPCGSDKITIAIEPETGYTHIL